MDRPDPTTIAAIALWGRRPILLISGMTNHPASALAGIMADALPDLRPRERAETEAIWRRAGIPRSRAREARLPPSVSALPGDPIFGDETEPVGLGELATTASSVPTTSRRGTSAMSQSC